MSNPCGATVAPSLTSHWTHLEGLGLQTTSYCTYEALGNMPATRRGIITFLFPFLIRLFDIAPMTNDENFSIQKARAHGGEAQHLRCQVQRLEPLPTVTRLSFTD